MAKKTSTSKIVELPGVEGPGVSPVSIAEIDKLAEKYTTEKDKRCRLTPKEVAAKGALIDAIHKHEKKLGRNPDGNITYRYNDVDFVLKPGKEKLSMVKVDTEEL